MKYVNVVNKAMLENEFRKYLTLLESSSSIVASHDLTPTLKIKNLPTTDELSKSFVPATNLKRGRKSKTATIQYVEHRKQFRHFLSSMAKSNTKPTDIKGEVIDSILQKLGCKNINSKHMHWAVEFQRPFRGTEFDDIISIVMVSIDFNKHTPMFYGLCAQTRETKETIFFIFENQSTNIRTPEQCFFNMSNFSKTVMAHEFTHYLQHYHGDEYDIKDDYFKTYFLTKIELESHLFQFSFDIGQLMRKRNWENLIWSWNTDLHSFQNLFYHVYIRPWIQNVYRGNSVIKDHGIPRNIDFRKVATDRQRYQYEVHEKQIKLIYDISKTCWTGLKRDWKKVQNECPEGFRNLIETPLSSEMLDRVQQAA